MGNLFFILISLFDSLKILKMSEARKNEKPKVLVAQKNESPDWLVLENKVPAGAVKLGGIRKVNLLTSIIEKGGMKKRNEVYKPKDNESRQAVKICQRNSVSTVTEAIEQKSEINLRSDDEKKTSKFVMGKNVRNLVANFESSNEKH